MGSRRWLPRALIITGLLAVMLLIVVVNRGPLIDGFPPAQRAPDEQLPFCLWCDDAAAPTFTDYLGTALIVLLVFCIPIGHIAVIVLAVQQLRQDSSVRASPCAAMCPYCENPIRRGWKACPVCGNRLGTPQSDTPRDSAK